MQPIGCKARWNTNFLLFITTYQSLKITYQTASNKNNAFIVRMRYFPLTCKNCQTDKKDNLIYELKK